MAENRRLKILQVNTSDRGGGAEGSSWNLFQKYKQLGHDSRLAVGYKYSEDSNVYQMDPFSFSKGNWNVWAAIWLSIGNALKPSLGRGRGVGRTLKWLRRIGSPSIFLNYMRGVEDFNFSSTDKLLDLVETRPDIIHCHNLHGGYFNLAALPSLSRNVPVILNLRDAWLLGGHCAHSFECTRWVTGCGDCPDLDVPPRVRRDSTAYNWQRKKKIFGESRLYVTTPSRWLMDKVEKSMLGYVDARVIPNGIDTSIFCPGDRYLARNNLGIQDDARVVLFTAHNEFKDYETMEKSLTLIKPDKNDGELIFICLGKKGNSRRIGNGVLKFAGFERNMDRLVDIYRSADIYIHAARAEVFGKTVTEALACGTPVVATKTGGVPEQIIDGRTGYLVSHGDIQEMAERIMELLTKEEMRCKFSMDGVADVRRRFSLEVQADSFIDWYYDVIDKWKSSSN